jgi:glycosyltransferase involved in cell wall biosynthesis
MSTNDETPLIALFLPSLDMGGAERVLLALARGFIQKGMRVDLLVGSKSGALIDEVDPSVNVIDLRAIRAGEPPWWSALKTLVGLVRYLRGSSPKAMMSTLTGANLITVLARMIANNSFHLVLREATSLSNIKSKTRFALVRLLYRYADKVVVLTGTVKDEMVTTMRLSEEKVVVIGNPVDCVRIRKLSDPSGINESINVYSPYALVVGRLVEPKDHFTVIDAIARVGDKRGLNLVIIGEGSQKTLLQKYSQERGVSDCVHFLGIQSNPYPWIRYAKVFVLSSKWEGYPNVLLEAMCFGKPIVATKYDVSLQNILSSYPSELKRIVNVGDGESMADAITMMCRVIGSNDFSVKPDFTEVLCTYIRVLELEF